MEKDKTETAETPKPKTWDEMSDEERIFGLLRETPVSPPEIRLSMSEADEEALVDLFKKDKGLNRLKIIEADPAPDPIYELRRLLGQYPAAIKQVDQIEAILGELKEALIVAVAAVTPCDLPSGLRPDLPTCGHCQATHTPENPVVTYPDGDTSCEQCIQVDFADIAAREIEAICLGAQAEQERLNHGISFLEQQLETWTAGTFELREALSEARGGESNGGEHAIVEAAKLIRDQRAKIARLKEHRHTIRKSRDSARGDLATANSTIEELNDWLDSMRRLAAQETADREEFRAKFGAQDNETWDAFGARLAREMTASSIRIAELEDLVGQGAEPCVIEASQNTGPIRAAAKAIRSAAKSIPMGGTISIRGDTPISSFNLAEHMARTLEDLCCERVVYGRLCDQPKDAPAGANEPEQPSRKVDPLAKAKTHHDGALECYKGDNVAGVTGHLLHCMGCALEHMEAERIRSSQMEDRSREMASAIEGLDKELESVTADVGYLDERQGDTSVIVERLTGTVGMHHHGDGKYTRVLPVGWPNQDPGAPEPPQPEPQPDISAWPGLAEWLANGRRGVSSETMVEVITGIKTGREGSRRHPLDAGDLRRCVDLVNAVPSMREHLMMMCSESTKWAGIVLNWDGLESLANAGQNSILNRRIRELTK